MTTASFNPSRRCSSPPARHWPDPNRRANPLDTVPMSGDSMRVIEHRYDAFISYNHGADGELAPAVERGPPAHRQAVVPLACPVDLPRHERHGPQPELAGNGRAAARREPVADPARLPGVAASGCRVGQEVAHWCDHKSVETVLVVHTGGELLWITPRDGSRPSRPRSDPEIAVRFTQRTSAARTFHGLAEQPTPYLGGQRRFKSPKTARLASPIRDFSDPT